MNVYADFDYYVNTYEGVKFLDSASSKRYLLEASAIIDQHTFGRCANLDTISEEIKYCCCELADACYDKSEAMKHVGTGKTSESVSSWSVAFGKADDVNREYKNRYNEIILKWLYNTGLLYGGVDE